MLHPELYPNLTVMLALGNKSVGLLTNNSVQMEEERNGVKCIFPGAAATTSRHLSLSLSLSLLFLRDGVYICNGNAKIKPQTS